MMGGQKAPLAFTTINLHVGTIRIYDFDGIRLHAYDTKDPFGDESYLFETEHELIGLESPMFLNNLTEYADYVNSLGKPLNHFIMAYHPGGSNAFIYCRTYATETTKKSISEGGSIKTLIDNFSAAFGNHLNPYIPAITNIIKAGRITIGDIEFVVKDTKESFDLEIPAINAVYTHMVGNRVHNILESPEQIDAMIGQMNDYTKKKPSLILTTHDIPATVEVAAEKATYLKTIKELALRSKDKTSFVEQASATFPEYDGRDYLKMSAAALF
ncbi:hypothetical protein [Treponema primitia]|uniref:hypothetical protein n=1 Tax=Treponema primitia TaxID=88058 RepID=UPI0002554CA4|nr:hypothetical protein [Treponema primitia]